MAGLDYSYCAKCGTRAFYDAELNWGSATQEPQPEVKPVGQGLAIYDTLENTGQLGCLCLDCSKTHELVVRSLTPE